MAKHTAWCFKSGLEFQTSTSTYTLHPIIQKWAVTANNEDWYDIFESALAYGREWQYKTIQEFTAFFRAIQLFVKDGGTWS